MDGKHRSEGVAICSPELHPRGARLRPRVLGRPTYAAARTPTGRRAVHTLLEYSPVCLFGTTSNATVVTSRGRKLDTCVSLTQNGDGGIRGGTAGIQAAFMPSGMSRDADEEPGRAPAGQEGGRVEE